MKQVMRLGACYEFIRMRRMIGMTTLCRISGYLPVVHFPLQFFLFVLISFWPVKVEANFNSFLAITNMAPGATLIEEI